MVSIAGWAIAVVSPAISMRSFAEEARLGTLEVLLTSPLSAFELVLGKFLAAVGVLLVLGLPMLVLFAVAEGYGDPDPGEFASGLLGLLLAGSTLLALGSADLDPDLQPGRRLSADLLRVLRGGAGREGDSLRSSTPCPRTC